MHLNKKQSTERQAHRTRQLLLKGFIQAGATTLLLSLLAGASVVSLASPAAYKYNIERAISPDPGFQSRWNQALDKMYQRGEINSEQLSRNRNSIAESAPAALDGMVITGTVTVMADQDSSSEAYPSIVFNTGQVIQSFSFRDANLVLTRRDGKFIVSTNDSNTVPIRFTRSCGQLVLANHLSDRLRLDEVREGGRIRVYSEPASTKASGAESRLRHELVVEYESPESNRIISVSTRYVDELNKIPLRRYSISGDFGTADYVVEISRLDREGQITETETLTFQGDTEDFFSFDSIPIGATVVDIRNQANPVTFKWEGTLPSFKSNDAPNRYTIVYFIGALLCLGAGIFFWRKR